MTTSVIMGGMQTEIGRRLAEEMRVRDMNQPEVAEWFGVSQQSISRWLNGPRVPRREHTQDIARFLGLRVSEVRAILHEDRDGRDGARASMAVQLAELKAELRSLRAEVNDLKRQAARG